MEKFVKYLVKNAHDSLWGLVVSVAGYTKIPPGIKYPPSTKNHPSKYQFTWENGRRLQEYQIVYITKGKGEVETNKTKRININEGVIIFLFPGIWHRYKCSLKTGWDEYYIGFNGEIMDNLVKNSFINVSHPIVKIGHNELVLNLFMNIIEIINEEKTGFQQEASGILMHLLGTIYSLNKNKNFEDNNTEKIIKKAKLLMQENLYKNIDTKDIAVSLNKSYSWFRKLFKEYTGLAPSQYHLQLKINKAKELLINSNLSIKTIAFNLGFESNFYFSHIFKSKTGISPLEFRKGNGK